MVRLNWPLSNPINQKMAWRLICMQYRNSDETPEMRCARIYAPFKKILEDNPGFFSKNEFIQMHGYQYEDRKKKGSLMNYPTNYLYCTTCDSLVFIPYNFRDHRCVSGHLKECIAVNTHHGSISGSVVMGHGQGRWTS